MNKNRSLDIQQEERRKLFDEAMKAALSGENDEQAQTAFFEYFETIQDSVMSEARAIMENKDAQIVASRGGRTLTSQERQYYNTIIEALSSNDPKQAIANVEDTIPTTIIDTVFENLKQEYPILKYVDLLYVKENVRLVYNMTGPKKAVWGPLCATITNEVSGSLASVEAGKYALTTFVYLCRDMLKLGPVWLDKYVRTILSDSLAFGLEDGYVNGSGVNSPVGMIRDISSPLDNTSGHSKKDAVELKSFSISDLGEVLDELRKDQAGRRRPIGTPFFAYNPADQTKVLAARKVLGPQGYVDVVPYTLDFIESASIEEGEALVGLNHAYLGLVTGDPEGEIEFSDEYKFLEQNRTYVIKLRANGLPKDNTSFVRVDISGLTPFTPVSGFEPASPIEVEIVNTKAIKVEVDNSAPLDVNIANESPIEIVGGVEITNESGVDVNINDQPIEVIHIEDIV